MKLRSPILLLTAMTAGIAALGNAVNAASPDDTTKTRLGVALDQDLSQRDRTAVRRDRSLDLREQAARAVEARIQARLDTARQATPAKPTGPADPPGTPPDDQYGELSRIYQAMKPAAAAAVFEQLDMDVQMKIALRMRERATALILAAMTPKGAAQLSMALARRRAADARPLGPHAETMPPKAEGR